MRKQARQRARQRTDESFSRTFDVPVDSLTSHRVRDRRTGKPPNARQCASLRRMHPSAKIVTEVSGVINLSRPRADRTKGVFVIAVRQPEKSV